MPDATPPLVEASKAAPVPDLTAAGFWTPGAAKYLARSQVTLRRWRVVGGGPVYRLISGRAFYLREDLDAWIAGHRRFRNTTESAGAA